MILHFSLSMLYKYISLDKKFISYLNMFSCQIQNRCKQFWQNITKNISKEKERERGEKEGRFCD